MATYVIYSYDEMHDPEWCLEPGFYPNLGQAAMMAETLAIAFTAAAPAERGILKNNFGLTSFDVYERRPVDPKDTSPTAKTFISSKLLTSFKVEVQ